MKCLVFAAALALWPSMAVAQDVAVHERESSNHGFLVVRDQAGATIGSGELLQIVRNDRVSARLNFRLKDGSIDDEATEFTQGSTFRLISDHHLQRGPYFSHPIESWIDVPAQKVRVKSGGDDTADRNESMELTPDLANGLLFSLVRNLQRDIASLEVPYMAFTPKPRRVTLAISRIGKQTFHIARSSFTAEHYNIKIKLGGLTGIIAPIIGKQPEDIQVWVSGGRVPAIVRIDGALFDGGPIVRIQLASPTW